MSAEQHVIGMLGGAFDPVHFGHLRCAVEVSEQLGIDEVLLIPSSDPPHRDTHVASAAERVAMLRAAVADLAVCKVDTREMNRSGPSWSVLTLEELRAENPDSSLCMIVGEDAFLGLSQWHRWIEIFDFAHVVIARRPGWDLPAIGPLGDLLTERLVKDAADLRKQKSGKIYVCDITQLDISSTVIRERRSSGASIRYLLPDAVIQLIEASDSYQRNN